MQRYITWVRVKVGEYKYIDPNTDNAFNNATEGSVFTETPYMIEDGRFISYVEYPDATSQEQIDGLIEAYSSFNFTFITEQEANTLLLELGTDEFGVQSVTVDNFVFADNRPVDII